MFTGLMNQYDNLLALNFCHCENVEFEEINCFENSRVLRFLVLNISFTMHIWYFHQVLCFECLW